MPVNKSDLVSIRDVLPGDKNFILATWLRGLRYGNDWFEAIDTEAYYKVYHAVIETLLSLPTTLVRVACLKDDAEVILGYCISSGVRLDWVFVKGAWRGIGIAKILVPAEISIVSHLTVAGKALLRKRPDIKFNPFALS